MTLQIIDCDQGTDEWLAARRGLLTASIVGRLITPKTIKPANNDYSRNLMTELTAERITGRTVDIYPNRDMQRGTFDEPFARDTYANHYAPVQEVGFMVRDFDGAKLGYSPDGLVRDDGLIEIKSRQPKTHLQTIVNGAVPVENMAQIQAGLMVTGRTWCDYISYAGGMRLYTIRVEPDPQWQAAILDVLHLFEAFALQLIHTYETATAGMPDTEYVDPFQEIEIEL